MRIKDEDKLQLKEDIIKFLNSVEGYHNLSEIARAVGKAPPTVMKYVEEMKNEGKLIVIDKKSMKLIKIKECV